ncbi:hypothetical protein RRG08_018839 [Elysia crispata]|uniref:Uncharacterized protein n=1 Tax=Elysia crispata TaxID=231223 RepID=A0AAE0YCD0_9GAST|nr:hypothetical protein RRG08_018839 [Elysia crispata]
MACYLLKISLLPVLQYPVCPSRFLCCQSFHGLFSCRSSISCRFYMIQFALPGSCAVSPFMACYLWIVYLLPVLHDPVCPSRFLCCQSFDGLLPLDRLSPVGATLSSLPFPVLVLSVLSWLVFLSIVYLLPVLHYPVCPSRFLCCQSFDGLLPLDRLSPAGATLSSLPFPVLVLSVL